MSRQRPLDLVIGVAALLVGVAEVANRRERAGRRAFILGSDPGEIDGFSGAIDGR